MKTPPKKNYAVLWADDDLDDLLIMRETLERLDAKHHVVEAHNGQEVLEYLRTQHHPSGYPCLIILDINMPVLDGRDTLTAIRHEAKYNTIPVVMFTTSNSERDRSFCQSLGARLYTKPTRLAEYEQIITALLSHCNDYNEVECGLRQTL